MGIAQRIGIPAIVLLLAGGVLLGPEAANLIKPDSLGAVLTPLVSLAVGIILFEAGMTLDFAGYKTASKVIQRLLTVGTLITWLGTTAAIYYLIGIDVETALLAASLVIVTGPTVILPLLKRIRVIPRVHHILQWEGVLIDPIGVFVAILCFEFLTSGSGIDAAADFGLRIVVGVLVGLVGGFVTYFVLKKRLAPEHMVGVATLACAAFTFGLSEMLIAESGL
jgi:NhaP-type Na+/H+ or K+/H+ antiporter